MTAQKQVLCTLDEADREGVGNKARRLARLHQAAPSLFDVPTGILLFSGFAIEGHGALLEKVLPELGNGPFAVRSCGLEEDGADQSMAGKFHTELEVPVSGLGAAIDKVRQSFGENSCNNSVLIQKMLQPDFAGVLFTRSPENQGLASCEFTAGTAEALVSGKTEPQRADSGRWSANLYPPQSGLQGKMLAHLFLAGMIIEQFMGGPQDVEWAYDSSKRKLTILQCRDITTGVGSPILAEEQVRVAGIALASKTQKPDRPIFHNAAVREIVSSPTPLTRSFIEGLYDPEGSLGLGFGLLGLPHPRLDTPYVSSLFGKLYANIEVERKLFRSGPRLWWAIRRLKKRLRSEPEALMTWLAAKVDALSEHAPEDPLEEHDPVVLVAQVMERIRSFTREVYPTAYAATLLAQLSGEEARGVSSTGRMMRDLSRLHHTGDVEIFLKEWGQRSANDYELAEPRFAESPESAVEYARTFSDLPWHEEPAGQSFIQLKELAKDRAVRRLAPLRKRLMALERALGLEPGAIYYLQIKDLEAIAEDLIPPLGVQQLYRKRKRQEEAWEKIDLGDEITLEQLEWLEAGTPRSGGLSGKMISSKEPFRGIARLVTTIPEFPLSGDEILITRFLEPALVGHFPKSLGCIADMGGALSHAAIVARELSYPVLVLPGASTTILDGDLIEVSADGSITIRRTGTDKLKEPERGRC